MNCLLVLVLFDTHGTVQGYIHVATAHLSLFNVSFILRTNVLGCEFAEDVMYVILVEQSNKALSRRLLALSLLFPVSPTTTYFST